MITILHIDLKCEDENRPSLAHVWHEWTMQENGYFGGQLSSLSECGSACTG
jgi:hypothetical protein